jgi:hypothetical protein
LIDLFVTFVGKFGPSVIFDANFFTELGGLMCSMTLGGGELSPMEKELILETADDVFRGSTRGKPKPGETPWRTMFSFPDDVPSDPETLEVFWRWMRQCDVKEWKLSRKFARQIIEFIQDIAKTYGLDTDENARMFLTIEKELKRRAGQR